MDKQPEAEATFQRDGLSFYEVGKQEYGDGFVAAGFVAGHPEDSMYILFSRQDNPPTIILLRPDELAALLTCASGTIWSALLNAHLENIGVLPRE